MRGLILFLLSSGMRLAEALHVEVKDLDLGVQPSRVRLRAEITKGKRARVAYLSDEAVEAVEVITRKAAPERLVFDYGGDIWSREKIATVNFRRVAARAGLGDMIEGHRIHKVHFHVFRKFFVTKGSDVIGEHAAHALCGHGFYMDTYYQKSEEERAADYLKLVPHLSAFSKIETSKEEILATFNRQFLSMAGYTDEEVSSLGDLAEMTPTMVQELIKAKSMQSLGLNGNHQKVVPVAEVKGWIERGWDFVASLPEDEVVIRLPQQ
jgi:Phage integrase family